MTSTGRSGKDQRPTEASAGNGEKPEDGTRSTTDGFEDGGSGGTLVHVALNDAKDTSEQDSSELSKGESNGLLNKDEKEKREKVEEEKLEKRREREAVLSEEERSSLRGESRALKIQGNEQFGQGFWHEAAQFYTEALDICPLVYTYDRAIYLSNRAAAYIKLSDWEKAIKDCSEALDIGAPNEKALERRAHCYAHLEEKYEQAVEDYELLLKMYPDRSRIYGERIISLKRAINERNERMKQDMISKLKELGNMCLKPFGLSTDNFQLTQQPGGGYSISMKK